MYNLKYILKQTVKYISHPKSTNNEAFYNDYVLYASSKSTSQTEENEDVVEETTTEE